MVVVAARYGQLGNRLFLFGHLVAAAAEHGFRVWNPAFGDYAEGFEATAGDPLCRYPASGRRVPAARTLRRAAFAAAKAAARAGRGRGVVRVTGDDRQFELSTPWFVEAARRRPVLIQGWLFRDDAAFQARGDVVRAHFRPLRQHESRARGVLDGARRNAARIVGVHVRRGDYRTFMGGRYHFDDGTYVRLMREMRNLVPGGVRFLVCSDEPLDLGRFDGLDVVRGTGHPLEDLYAFAGCDYLLGPPSTYTAWASFYGRVPLYVVRAPEAQPRLDAFTVVTA